MMINCKECEYRLSDKADHCPNCGAPIEVAKPPPKPKPKEKKWWEKECNGWKVGTYLSLFLFVIFFIAYLTTVDSRKINNNKEQSIKQKFVPSVKNPKNKDISNLNKKRKELEKYSLEVKNARYLSYMKVMKVCKVIDEYSAVLKYIKLNKIKLDNNETIEGYFIQEKNLQNDIFPRLRRFYAKALREKFRGIQRSAAGGNKNKIIIFKANIFARKKEIEKFHKLIVHDLKKLRFIQAIYSLNKDNVKGYVFNIDSQDDGELP